MSEYADIMIRKLSIWSFCNYLDDVVGLIFSPTDLIIISDSAEDSEDEKSYQYPKYMYRSNVQKAKERLDALGYSLPKLEKEFKRDTEDLLELFRFSQTLTPNEEEAYIAAKGKLEKHVSYRKWMNAIKKVIKYELDNGNITFLKKEHDIAIKTMCDDLVFDSLRNDDPTYIYGMDLEYIDVGFIFRAILEYCEADDEVILDFTNLGDWADNSIEQGCGVAGNNEKTIVLVEGTSDKNILEFSLKHLYPHLADLFYFMDFDYGNQRKREGGTSYLIKNIKTFYFSRIRTRFIAIFDNDAEGNNSKCTLLRDIRNWPDNFRILQYPDIKAFRRYPTIAPNEKIVNDDINGRACSIELYLPDCIISNGSQYYPVEWETRLRVTCENGQRVAKYQGVISNKDGIKIHFHELMNKIENGKRVFNPEDWKRMKQLVDSIVFAFKD